MKGMLVFLVLLSFLFIIYDSLIKERWLIDRGIKEAKRLIEERNFEQAFSYVSRNYRDKYGHDYEALKIDIQDFLKDFGDFKITILGKRKKFKGKSCEVYLLAIIETSHREFGYLKGREYLRISLVKEEDGVWRVVEGEPVEYVTPLEMESVPEPFEEGKRSLIKG